MRYLILIAATLAAGALGAQTYTVTQITNDFAAKNIVSYGTGVTGSFTAPGSSTPDTDDGVVGPATRAAARKDTRPGGFKAAKPIKDSD